MPFQDLKETGFVGFKSKGATCLNSLLQTLYHLPYYKKVTVVEGTIQQLFDVHHMNYLECINVDSLNTSQRAKNRCMALGPAEEVTEGGRKRKRGRGGWIHRSR
ncbi:hypothetical protein R1flu_011406 [Riccia fluitans]|uniref:Uncharacterized protein n=1 Tax=Riccia fluitans TaxID=41844 RepID=A0ABD1ZAA9_9MARC